MKRISNILFHLSGTGFLVAVALWGYILHAQKSIGYGSRYNPLEPALPIRILAISVATATVLSIAATLLSYGSWARSRFFQGKSTPA
jgi:hypothetical protein